MAETEQLKIQIVLDDGSVKQGFVELEKQAKKSGDKMAHDGFDKITSSAEGLAQALEGNVGGALTGIAETLGPGGAATLAIGAAIGAFAKLGLEGEKVISTNIQFAEVAKSVGISAQKLSDDLISVSEGLIDDTDLFQRATRSVVAFGSQAERLPDVLRLSLAVSRTLGKDFKETFETLTLFLETGNAKALKQFGIILDLDKAYERAAKSIGLTSSELTEQQKQTVRLNLALEELPKKFDLAAKSVTPLNDLFDRGSTLLKNYWEWVEQTDAEFLHKFTDAADKSNVATSRLEKELEAANNRVIALSNTLTTLNKEKLGAKGASDILYYTDNIKAFSEELVNTKDKVQKLMVELSGRSDADLFRALDASHAANPEKLKLTQDQIDKIFKDRKSREDELTKFISAQEITRRQAELETVNSKDAVSQQITSNQLRLNQQLELLEVQHKAKLQEIETQFSNDKKFTAEQREQAIVALTASYNAEKLKLEQDSNSQLLELNKTYAEQAVLNIRSIGDAITYVGKTAKQQLAGAFVNGMQAATSAIAKGQNGMDALVKSVLSSIGDIAVQFGSLFLLQAAGFAVIPGLQGNASTLAAAGVGLIGLGIALKSLSGGGATEAPTQAGGGIASTQGSSTELTPQQDLTRAEPGTSVVVHVHGDVLDSDESGSRIVNLINQAFDKKGVVINQAVMA